MKFWQGIEAGDDKFIIIDDSKVYKSTPKSEDTDTYIALLENSTVPKQGFTCIPFRYLQEISMQEGKNCIQLVMGKDSEEELKIHNALIREEIFNYLKEHIPGGIFKKEQYSKIKAGEKPLIALAVVLCLFLWTMFYTISYENGVEYRITNGHYNSLTGIVLAIASLGKAKVIGLFSGLAAIALLSFYMKAKNPPIISRIKFR